MSVRAGSGLSTEASPRPAAIAAAQQAREALHGSPVDLAVVFASGSHLVDPEATLSAVDEALAPAAVVGCGSSGVLARGREVEDGTGVAVWAASFGSGRADTFHIHATEGDGGVTGLPAVDGASGLLMLADPYSFPTDRALDRIGEQAPGLPVVGGLPSARSLGGGAVLFHDRAVHDDGAVAVRLQGIDLLPCVSQGAAPLGPELTVTDCDGHVITELAGRPALETLRSVIAGMPERERRLVARGLLIGLLIEGGKPDYEQGDFLVRGVLGADPESGAIAVGATVKTGQVVRLHARDAESADRDLHDALRLRREALGAPAAAGALMFTCNGRGRDMFGVPDHDAEAVMAELDGAPAAGFFAAGEIGPVGGGSFLHGFTATVAVFAS